MGNEILTIIGFSIIFLATTLGSSFVFFLKKNISKNLNSLLLSISGGIMFSASIWSLLLPSIEGSANYGNLKFIPVSVGFLAGGLFLVILDKLILFFNKNNNKKEFFLTKPFKMFIAITIHNIPEGLAVGLAFGGAYLIGSTEAFINALGLAIGIAIQNLPEGAAVSMPLKSVTESKSKSFFMGLLSGLVEPISAVIGLLISAHLLNAQPWFLSFAAGAMIFVVVEEIIPDINIKKRPYIGTWGFIAGFIIMMILDITL